MGTSSFGGIFDVLITAFGVYILYAWFLMKTKKEIRGGMFLPKGIDPEKCRDRDGYIGYAGPRFLLLGILCLLSGLLGLAVDYLGVFPEDAYLAVTVLFLVFLIWFGFTVKKAVDRYWN